jgi:hypothetical protein
MKVTSIHVAFLRRLDDGERISAEWVAPELADLAIWGLASWADDIAITPAGRAALALYEMARQQT